MYRYRNLAVVQQKIYSYLTRFKNVAFHANFFYALQQTGPHHVVCLRAPTILNPPLVLHLRFSTKSSRLSVSGPKTGIPHPRNTETLKTIVYQTAPLAKLPPGGFNLSMFASLLELILMSRITK